MFKADVAAGKLPPVEKRLPQNPRVMPLEQGKTQGHHGGTLQSLAGRSRDTRLFTIYGYARLVVYTRAPGAVARCSACSSVLMVFVTVREVTCVDLRGLAALERAT